jgi:hypothetical protein
VTRPVDEFSLAGELIDADLTVDPVADRHRLRPEGALARVLCAVHVLQHVHCDRNACNER